MAKYRKKPVVIEANIYKPGMEDGYKVYCTEYPEEGYFYLRKDEYLIHEEQHKVEFPDDDRSCYTIICPVIFSLEGPIEIAEGDYIITGIKGERYLCKPDIFVETYEPV